MKQSITKEQWTELDEKQRGVLVCAITGYVVPEGNTLGVESIDPLPNIGQMIEFLGDEYWRDVIMIDNVSIIDVDTLCDELWRVVKTKQKII